MGRSDVRFDTVGRKVRDPQSSLPPFALPLPPLLDASTKWAAAITPPAAIKLQLRLSVEK